MIGYDAGARIDLDNAPTVHSASGDTQQLEMQNAIDRISAFMGMMPAMASGIERNITDVAVAVSEAADAVGRISRESTKSGGLDTSEMSLAGAASFIKESRYDSDDHQNNLMPDWKSIAGKQFSDVENARSYRDHDEKMDKMTAQMRVDAAEEFALPYRGGATPRSETVSDILSQDAVVSLEAENPGSVLRNADRMLPVMNLQGLDDNILTFLRSTGDQVDHRYHLSGGKNNNDWEMRVDSIFRAIEGAFSRSSQIDGHSVPSDSALSSTADIPSNGGKISDAYKDQSNQFLPVGGYGTLHDQIDDVSGNFLRQDSSGIGPVKKDGMTDVDTTFGGFGHVFYRQAGRDVAGNEILAPFGHEEQIGRDEDQQLLARLHANDTSKANSSRARVTTPGNAFLPLPGTFGGKDDAEFAELSRMLRNVERLLPKPGTMSVNGAGDASVEMIESATARSDGLLNGLLTAGVSDERDDDALNAPARQIAGRQGRYGPSGYRNDPIYMIAINPGFGTMMPTVPTPGTSTRTPPIPGQRNLA